ncbi:MAG: hypothetical protein M1812_007776 [Candelaria pacifica]|nr:MAG: hypothetical protein M1812_007776 [Candelaria pacifica]
MGYCETLCQLCGVSFAIARLRRADEPESAAWDYSGSGYVEEEDGDDIIENTCGGTHISGCYLQERENRFDGERGPAHEHISGQGCASGRGYSGHRISLMEMKGCRTVQCLVKKEDGWKEEDGDQEWERESEYFLTGWGDGSPDESPLEDITPPRHGVDSLIISNICYSDDEDEGLPFHPSCFEIFKKVSLLRLGTIDVHGLWSWRLVEGSFEAFFEDFPRHYGIKNANEQWWNHEPGNEFLVANPVNIPALDCLLSKISHLSPGEVFERRYPATGQRSPNNNHPTLPPPTKNSDEKKKSPEKPFNDPFTNLSAELTSMILEYLGSQDIARLRLASPSFSQLPGLLFRRLLFDDMPWFWEAKALNHQTDWRELYCKVKFCWLDLKGLKNRKRIWKDVEEVVRRIEMYRKRGDIGKDWKGRLPDLECGNGMMNDSDDE